MVAGPALFGLASVLFSDEALGFIDKHGGSKDAWRWIAIILMLASFVATILFVIASRRRTARLTELERENQRLQGLVDSFSEDLFGWVEDSLKSIAGILGFGTRNDGTAERITIYAYDGKGFFTAFGRYSENPKFAKKGKRSQYTEDEGCIGKAWRDGWYFRTDYPDPHSDLDGWVARCVKDGMAEATARNINMKSRLYCGYRINSKSKVPLAVVIIESTDPTRYNSEYLRTLFGAVDGMLREPLDRFQAVLPRSTDARRLGF